MNEFIEEIDSLFESSRKTFYYNKKKLFKITSVLQKKITGNLLFLTSLFIFVKKFGKKPISKKMWTILLQKYSPGTDFEKFEKHCDECFLDYMSYVKNSIERIGEKTEAIIRWWKLLDSNNTDENLYNVDFEVDNKFLTCFFAEGDPRLWEMYIGLPVNIEKEKINTYNIFINFIKK